MRANQATGDSLGCRLALADRIADLPGISTVEEPGDSIPYRVRVCFQAASVSIRREQPPLPLCTIGPDGIHLHALNEWDRHQVLRGGWGRLERDHVLLFLPRNDEELEVCWAMLQRAYGCLSAVSAVTPMVRVVSPWDLPRVSRTTLQ